MKIYDISQEVFGCNVFDGDPKPQRIQVNSIDNGDLYNLTAFSMCAHNGTHLDAPSHFLQDGKSIENLDLEKTVGYACVVEYDGMVTSEVAKRIINESVTAVDDSGKRILLKGNAVITEEAANVFAENKIYLLGVESQSVGPVESPMRVHKLLLEKEVVLLEGICLENVPAGVYFLNAAPLNLKGSDGAPCRAILIKM